MIRQSFVIFLCTMCEICYKIVLFWRFQSQNSVLITKQPGGLKL